MNPLTNVRNVKKLSEQELSRNFKGSWHDQYKDSAWIFVGGVSFDLSEGDVITVFSQYGSIVNINWIRDKDKGTSKGYGFLCYEDQRSTILAVDNLNGIKVRDRVIRVDHVSEYKVGKGRDIEVNGIVTTDKTFLDHANKKEVGGYVEESYKTSERHSERGYEDRCENVKVEPKKRHKNSDKVKKEPREPAQYMQRIEEPREKATTYGSDDEEPRKRRKKNEKEKERNYENANDETKERNWNSENSKRKGVDYGKIQGEPREREKYSEIMKVEPRERVGRHEKLREEPKKKIIKYEKITKYEKIREETKEKNLVKSRDRKNRDRNLDTEKEEDKGRDKKYDTRKEYKEEPRGKDRHSDKFRDEHRERERRNDYY